MESSGSLPLGGVFPRKWPGQRGAAAPESGAWASVWRSSSPTESSPTFRLVDLRGVGLSTEEGENTRELSMPFPACLHCPLDFLHSVSHLTRCFLLGQCTSPRSPPHSCLSGTQVLRGRGLLAWPGLCQEPLPLHGRHSDTCKEKEHWF